MNEHKVLIGEVVDGLVTHHQEDWAANDRVTDPQGRRLALVDDLAGIGGIAQDEHLVHVDATRGSDTTGDGTLAKPYKTLAHAHDAWAAGHPHGNNVAEWSRKVVFLLAPGLYDAGAASVTLKHHRRAVGVRGDGAIIAPKVGCVADQADAPAVLAALGAGLPGAYALAFAAAPGAVIGDTYTDPAGTVWTVRGLDDAGTTVYVDSALADTVRPNLTGAWTRASGSGPATITPATEANLMPLPQSKVDNSWAEQMRIFDFAGVGGGMEGGHPAINLVLLKGIEWGETSPPNAFVDFLFCDRIQTIDGGIVNVGPSAGGVTVELDSCSIGAFGGYIGGSAGVITLKAANSQLKAMLAGKVQLYEIDNCRIVNINETVNPADGSTGFAGNIACGTGTAYSGITNTAFAGSTYVYTDLRLDALSLSRLLAAGGAPDLSKIAFNDQARAVNYTATPADWDGTPPVTVQDAINRLAATLVDHVGSGIGG